MIERSKDDRGIMFFVIPWINYVCINCMRTLSVTCVLLKYFWIVMKFAAVEFIWENVTSLCDTVFAFLCVSALFMSN